MTVGRRAFLMNLAFAGAGVAAIDALRHAGINGALASSDLLSNHSPFGPLRPTLSLNTSEELIALPEGFNYKVLGRAGKRMEDGNITPRAHDGMYAFQVGKEVRLVRNHEVSSPNGVLGSAIGRNPYDSLAGGGTTTLVIDPTTRELIRDFVSLSGTLVNCAGGPTPWNSWISCEETISGTSKRTTSSGSIIGGFEQPHGYCFEVPAAANGPVDAVPLKAMGRFKHEAIAVDPRDGLVYLTEDNGGSDPGGFYRFIPKRARRLAAGGTLELLKIKGESSYDTRRNQTVGKALPVEWIRINDPDPPEAETDASAVYKQGAASGAAIFARLEGVVYGNGKIFFTSTSGGNRGRGQVWEYKKKGKSEGELTLLYEPEANEVFAGPDNVGLSKAGTLLVCEDNSKDVHVHLLTAGGKPFPLLKNLMPKKEGETRELAGITFSPDGKTIFLNMQGPGLTLAIWGPFDRI